MMKFNTSPGVMVTQTKVAQPMGICTPTGVDHDKKRAAFLLVGVGKKNAIRWASGQIEYVTDKALNKLQAQHPSWMTDF